MRKVVFIIVSFLLVSCNNSPVEKPEKFIDEETMTNILYDLTLLDAIRTQNPYDSVNQSIKPKEFIYQKYKIDSVQFVENNQYYISQINTYKKIYDNINERIQKEKADNDLLLKKNGTVTPSGASSSDKPQIQ